MPTVATVVADYLSLSIADQNIIKSKLISLTPVTGTLNAYVENKRFAVDRTCPHCGTSSVVRNGKRKDGTQRYLCKDCGKSFIARSNSITYGTRKSLVTWETFIECMLMGLSLEKTAVMCKIHRNTAFYWRHKVLDALQTMADEVKLNGIIEADETFFEVSYKGNHSKSSTPLPRAAHHRGKSSKLRGLSKDKVCVPCAVTRTGLSISKISNLARIRIKGLEGVFNGRIEPGSSLVTDKASAYKQFTANNNIELKQVKSGLHTTKGIYNIQHINSYHSHLKSFISRFNGVSTKYLNNYLIWHNFLNYSNGNFEHKRDSLLSYVLCKQFSEYVKDISNRIALPLLA